VGNASNTLSVWPLYDPRSNGKWKKLRQISAALIVAASEYVACAWTTFNVAAAQDRVGVAVKNGVVTLTGFVRSYSQKINNHQQRRA
jgi:ferric-dicitrate binding protein FerR (iron transport regulator)